MNIQANQLTYHDLTIAGFDLQASNQRGQGGTDAPDRAHRQGKLRHQRYGAEPDRPAAPGTLQPRLQQIALQPLLKAFALPEFIVGRLALDATLRSSGLASATLLRHWQGNGAMTIDDVRLEGLNIAQLVQIPLHIYSDWRQLNYQLNVD